MQYSDGRRIKMIDGSMSSSALEVEEEYLGYENL